MQLYKILKSQFVGVSVSVVVCVREWRQNIVEELLYPPFSALAKYYSRIQSPLSTLQNILH